VAHAVAINAPPGTEVRGIEPHAAPHVLEEEGHDDDGVGSPSTH
jgi:hypothetical protein